MNKLNQIIFMLCLLIFTFYRLGYSQPDIPKESIPSGIPYDVRSEIEGLYSDDPIERAYAANHLGVMGTKAAPAVPYLIGILHDITPLQYSGSGNSTSPGKEASWALEKIGKFAVESLIAALNDKDATIRYTSVELLGKIGDVRAVEPLITTLKDKQFFVRFFAVKALGALGDVRAVEPLVAMLHDKSTEVQNCVVEELKNFGTPAVEPLIAELKNGDYMERANAAFVLGEIGDARAVEPLVATLKERDIFVQSLTSVALRRIGTPAVEPLIATLNDEGWKDKNEAAEILKKITKHDFGTDYKKWKDWWEEENGVVQKNR